jgi:hypothetical protein
MLQSCNVGGRASLSLVVLYISLMVQCILDAVSLPLGRSGALAGDQSIGPVFADHSLAGPPGAAEDSQHGCYHRLELQGVLYSSGQCVA